MSHGVKKEHIKNTSMMTIKMMNTKMAQFDVGAGIGYDKALMVVGVLMRRMTKMVSSAPQRGGRWMRRSRTRTRGTRPALP